MGQRETIKQAIQSMICHIMMATSNTSFNTERTAEWCDPSLKAPARSAPFATKVGVDILSIFGFDPFTFSSCFEKGSISNCSNIREIFDHFIKTDSRICYLVPVLRNGNSKLHRPPVKRRLFQTRATTTWGFNERVAFSKHRDYIKKN